MRLYFRGVSLHLLEDQVVRDLPGWFRFFGQGYMLYWVFLCLSGFAVCLSLLLVFIGYCIDRRWALYLTR